VKKDKRVYFIMWMGKMLGELVVGKDINSKTGIEGLEKIM
jgi:hypothetical protein